ncbi:DNA-binding protein [Polymorphobacter multimanifer]|uniref:hemolysin family protein n=1 Tax=Polymorphobacter multimanifer TaxID=1070431 RepID=UPI00166CF638|nr:hemolysin family protein [Polymorphobacter multimanifer]GGI93072.1 DNA-binding protein [Polymorphobacter multimanifer]
MQPFPWFDVAIIAALVLLNGFFAMSELAIVSARKPRLRALAETGYRGAHAALSLGENPGRFLSAVQIGITLVGVVNGAYSGATLALPVGERITQWFGVPEILADEIGFGVVIVLITYLSLIIGELVPKQFALRAPEKIACLAAPIMVFVARLATPAVWALENSTGAVLRLFGPANDEDNRVTEAELRSVMEDAETAGAKNGEEPGMESGKIPVADRRVRGVMTPRGDVDWLDAAAPEAAIREKLRHTPHARLPVARGTVVDIIGVVQARDIVQALIEGRPLDIAALARPAPVIPDVIDAVDALGSLRSATIPMALVHDEYGHFEGIVTPADLLAAIAGAFAFDADATDEPSIFEREDGSLLLAGSLPADEMADRLGLNLDDDRDYETLAGFVLAQLQHIPETGELFRCGGWQFEIVDMDGRKVDKVLASVLDPEMD